ncbi:hypothetical protein BDZ85DRAFT_129056 [Elsinoe ampelina]|uniref:Uncharacterized protein n=1 Tax=Elsinoe ampelina TaxID=302913 RepID=A0A6A6G9V4_9PEZI|nr:hypothetical protein BDZ85DRAFT_129056 [Elsinoe ampelina]
MAALHIPSAGLPLIGWPAEPYRHSSKESTIKRSAVVLKVNRQIIQDLQECAKSGKAVRLLAGRAPRIQYGPKSIDLQVEPEKFTHELYTNDPSHDSLEYIASVTQRASLTQSSSIMAQDTAGTDNALAALKQNLASVAHDKQANQATISNSVFADPQVAKRNRILSDRFVPRSGSQHSPSLGATKHLSAPTSAPPNEQVRRERLKALTPAVLHFLASDPKDEHTIHKTTKIPPADIPLVLQKHAEFDTSSKKWKLKDRSYKDLDIWEFNWRGQSELRDKAIDNSVRAFDRIRLGKDDKLWQMLLPQGERGKGKLLSRLHGNNNQSGNHLTVAKDRLSPPGASSPLAVASDTDSKANGRLTPKPSSTPMSRTASAPGKTMSIEKRLKESQKARAAEEAKEARRKEKESKVNSSQGTAAAKGPKTTTSTKKQPPSKFKSDEIVHSSDDESASEGKDAHIIKARAQPAARDAPSPQSTSSSDGKPLKDSSLVKNAKDSTLKPSAPKQAVSTNTAMKRDSPQKVAASKGAATPLPSGDTKAKTEARKETPTERVEKRAGDKPAAKPQLSPRKADTTKPKNPSPLGRTTMANATPSMFGNHERSPSLIKKATTTARAEPPKKRTAPADDSDRERPRKAVKTNGTATPNKSSAPLPPSEHKAPPKKSTPASAKPISTTETPRKPPSPPKRKAPDASPLPHTHYPKHRRTESASTNSASSSASRTTTARTSVSSQSPPSHIPLTSLSQPAANGSYSPSTASSSSDPLGKYGWEKAIEDAERFRTVLYPKYIKLHARVTALGDRAEREEVERVWRMHERLKGLKEEIRRGSREV